MGNAFLNGTQGWHRVKQGSFDFWLCNAVAEGLEAVDKFEETGSRKNFGEWLKKYGNKFDTEKAEQEGVEER